MSVLDETVVIDRTGQIWELVHVGQSGLSRESEFVLILSSPAVYQASLSLYSTRIFHHPIVLLSSDFRRSCGEVSVCVEMDRRPFSWDDDRDHFRRIV